MWAEYQQERLGKHVLESDKGFALYSFIDSKQCYLEDIYVSPEHRKSGAAAELADQISELARKQGYEYLIGSVVCGANGDTESLKVLLAYGMHLLEVHGNLIMFSKKLGE